MDFLKSLTTSAISIPDWNYVTFHTYYVHPEPGPRQTKTPSQVTHLWIAETSLRKRGKLVSIDVDRGRLWIFEAAASAVEGDIKVDAPDLSENRLHVTEAAAPVRFPLARYKARFPKPARSPSAISPTGLPTGFRAAQAANLQAFHQSADAAASDQEGYFENKFRYEQLLKAIVGVITYALVKDAGLIPCGNKRFLLLNTSECPNGNNKAADESSPWQRVRASELLLHVELATAGTLIVSFSNACSMDLWRLNRNKEIPEVVEGQPIKLVPGRMPARLMRYASEADSPEKQLKIVKWKEAARVWLEGKGFKAGDDIDWVWVSFNLERKFILKDIDSEFLWPSSLCFSTTYPNETPSVLQPPGSAGISADGSDWPPREKSNEYEDPLMWAEQWIGSKTSRDAEIKSAAEAEKVEEESVVQEIDFASSPAYTRTAMDMVSVSGMYPTPPDGFLAPASQPTQGDIDNLIVPSSIGPTTTTDAMDVDATTAPDGPTQVHDDLFGDMDEDFGEGGHDVDFSFFDEPGDGPAADDIGMVLEANLRALNAQTSVSLPDIQPTAADIKDLDILLEEHQDIPPAESDNAVHEIIPNATDGFPLEDPQSSIAENPSLQLESTGQISPPLSPAIVRKKLFPSDDDDRNKRSASRRESLFNFVDFSKRLKLNDAKYRVDGIFSFNNDKAKENSTKTASRDVGRVPTSITLPVKPIRDDEDSSETSSTSGSPEDEPKSATSVPAYLLYAQRRPDSSQIGTPAVSSTWEDEVKDENVVSDNQIPLFLHLLDQKKLPSFMTATKYINAPGQIIERDSKSDIPQPFNRKDLIYVAQTLVQQAVGSNFEFIFGDANSDQQSKEHSWNFTEQHGEHNITLYQTIKRAFPSALLCELPRYVSIQDLIPEPPITSKHPRASAVRRSVSGVSSDVLNNITFPPNSVFTILPQRIRVRRNDTQWDLLPPSVSFWEALSVAPSSGPKDVKAWCVYASSESLSNPINAFFEAMASTFENFKLGTHSRGSGVADFANGLVQVVQDARTKSLPGAMDIFRRTMARFGTKLGGSPAAQSETGTIVIYLVDPFGVPDTLLRLCAAFWDFFHAYSQASPSRNPKADVVLQVLPFPRIANRQAPVIYDPTIIAELALEVYDRCPPNQIAGPSEPGRLNIYAAPSIHLEEPLPKNVPFKLIADPPNDLLLEGSSMHLGYAIGEKGDWIAAAWTDSMGKSQWQSCYSLRGRVFTDIAKEIWLTTLEILRTRMVSWRVAIAKAGIMSGDEADTWTVLASASRGINITTILISFFEPPLELTSPVTARLSLATQDASVSTPAATPKHPSTPGPKTGLSPEPNSFTPAATPPDLSFNQATEMAKDPDAHLVDIADEVWGVILGHRLDGHLSMFEDRAPMLSGLLIRRNGHSSSDEGDNAERAGPAAVAVNLLWAGANLRKQNMAATASGTPSAAQPQRQMPGPQARTAPMTPAAAAAASLDPSSAASSPTVSPTGGIAGSVGGPESFPPRAVLENLFREYLTQYRGLALLARLKGMKGKNPGLVPWHVGVAMKGVEVLEKTIKDDYYE